MTSAAIKPGLGDLHLANGQTEAALAAAHSPRDRFTASYFLLVMSVFLLFWYSALYELFLVLLGLFIALIVAVVLLAQAILCCRRRQGRRLTSITAAPFPAWAILASLSRLGFDPHWLHLQLHKRAYLDEIARCECGPNGLHPTPKSQETAAAQAAS